MRLDGYGLFVKDMPAMIHFYRDVLGFEIKEDENTSNVYLLKDGTLFLLYGRNDFEKRTSKKYEYPQKAADFMRRMLTNHKFILIPYKSRHDFCHYPTTNLFVFSDILPERCICVVKNTKISPTPLDEKGRNG